jgi:hypothetical protein
LKGFLIMYKMKNILSILLIMMMFVFIAVPGALPVFAAETTVADTTSAAADTTAAGDTAAAADTTAAAVTTAAAKPIVISDTSNIIGIVVAVILGVGAIALIVILAPKNTAPKKK